MGAAELPNSLVDLVRSFEVADVSTIWDDHEFRSGDRVFELVRDAER
jgi:hypothetical protein